MSIKSTEREVSSWISQEINDIIKSGGYPFLESSVESSLDSGLAYPDITLWNDRQADDAFAFFEFKVPGLYFV
jgi:hypothetical protein